MANTNENKLPEDLTFEQALDRLETIVKTLEGKISNLTIGE